MMNRNAFGEDSSLSNIGVVYTPNIWANWLLDKGNVYQKWLYDSKRICDPTGGSGVFILELLRKAIGNKVILSREMISNLGYIEIDPNACNNFYGSASKIIGKMSKYIKIYNNDVVISPPNDKFDILVGNPPWVNFCDLPTEYKSYIKDKFIEYNLIHNDKSILLGSSRIDFAALVINASIGNLLDSSGLAYFYVPSSLYYGDNAHKKWRSFETNNRDFSTNWIYEFNKTKIFNNVGTSYFAVELEIDKQQSFPVKCFREKHSPLVWHIADLCPLKESNDQWVEKGVSFDTSSVKIKITKDQMPRQGVNTCGANSIFIFDHRPSYIPSEYLFPLVSNDCFIEKSRPPNKWIFIPYNIETQRPLSLTEIKEYPDLFDYLISHRDKLEKRKGVMLRSSLSKNVWWSLLGVGRYSFSPFKVIWKSYGQYKFEPIIISSYENMPWQGNQALHAFMPCWTETDAYRILSELKNPLIEDILNMMNGGGKCNWAQPGKMKKIISINSSTSQHFSLF